MRTWPPGAKRPNLITLIATLTALTAAGLVGSPGQLASAEPGPGPAAKVRPPWPGTPAQTIDGRYLVQSVARPVGDGGSRVSAQRALGSARAAARSAGAKVDAAFSELWSGISVTATPDQISQIARDPSVQAVYPVLLVPRPEPVRTTGRSATTAPAAEDAGPDGTGIRVGVIDTGIDYHHGDLGGSPGSSFPTDRVAYGYDFVGDAYGSDEAGYQPVPDRDPDDCAGHGTHVAGIIGAEGDPADGGVRGQAPGATLGAYRVFGCKGGTGTDIILEALTMAGNQGMDVVNLSLGWSFMGWPGYPTAVAAANLVKQGVAVVASAGNEGEYGLFSVGAPAVAPGVISVAAYNEATGLIADFSSAGLAADLSLAPTITAPGVDIRSTLPLEQGGGYGVMSGTSMASPYVAGVAAVVRQARGAMKPAALAGLLHNTAHWIEGSSVLGVAEHPKAVFRQGAGVVNLGMALDARVTAVPSVLNLGEGTTQTVTVKLTNNTSGPLVYTASGFSGVSAAPSTGTGDLRGNSTPDYAYGEAKVSVKPKSATVKAGKTASFKVTITSPSTILPGRPGMLYGGWVVFQTTGAGNQVFVPYAGLRGDYQAVSVLNQFSWTDDRSGDRWEMPGLAAAIIENNQFVGLEPVGVDGHSFTAGGDSPRWPTVLYHLDYPAAELQLKVVNTVTRKAYDAILDWSTADPETGSIKSSSTHLYRQPRSWLGDILVMQGYYYAKGKMQTLPEGSYRMELRVLKPLGSSKKKAHWQSYPTPAFQLNWAG